MGCFISYAHDYMKELLNMDSYCRSTKKCITYNNVGPGVP